MTEELAIPMPFITHLQHPKRRTLRPHALLAILLLTTAAHAQEPNPTDLPGTRRITPGALRIVVLEGHNVRNSLQIGRASCRERV